MEITPSAPVNNGRSKIDISTDLFTSNLQQDEFTITLGSGVTAPVAAAAAHDANHLGVLAITMPTTTAIVASIATNATFLLGSGGEQFESVIKTPAAFLTTQTQRHGMLNLFTNAAPVNGSYFEIIGSTLSCKTASASAVTTSPTTLTLVANTYYHLRITAVSATAILYEVFSDAGVSLLSVTMTPPATGVLLAAGMVLFANATTTAGIGVNVDYVGFKVNRAISRGAAA